MREIVHIQAGQCGNQIVPNSGKLSQTNTVLTQPVHITVTQTYNWKELTSTTTKLLAVDTFQELSLWILNQVPWTQSEPVHSVNFSDQITSSSDKLVLVTTGLRDITLKVLN